MEENINDERRYYVYIFLDGRKPGEYKYGDYVFDYEPFYVGKGTGDRVKTSQLRRESKYKVNKIKKITREGYKVIDLIIEDNLTNIEAINKEVEIIKLIGRLSLNEGPLVNGTDGGDGRLNSRNSEESYKRAGEKIKQKAIQRKLDGLSGHTPETIEYLREINTGDKNPFYGKTHTKEVREAHSLRVSGTNHPMYGKKHDEETIKKIKEKRNKAVDQDKFNEESRKRNSKAILQYDLEGNFIQEFESAKIAAPIVEMNESYIGKICRGLIKKPTKFIFKFKNPEDIVLVNSFKYKVGEMFEMDGIEYQLLERKSRSCIVLFGDEVITLRKDGNEFLWDKNSLNLVK